MHRRRDRSYGIQWAVAFLEDFIAKQQDVKLPSIRKLAAIAGTAPGTMHKALIELKNRNLIGDGRKGKKSKQSVGGVSEIENSGQTPALKWQRIKKRLAHDIQSGAFPHGHLLPSVKVLLHRYGVSQSTLRKALLSLENDKVIASDRRGFRTVALAGASPLSRLTVIMYGNVASGTVRALGALDEEFLSSLETECRHARIALDTVFFASQADHLRFYTDLATESPGLQDKAETLGYLYVTNIGIAPIPDILFSFALFKKPVAIWDQLGGWKIPPLLRKKNIVRRFAGTNTLAAGVRMGRYLLGLGHRRIAFFSPFNAQQWARLRLEGIKQAFREAGFDDGVVPFVIENITILGDVFADGEKHGLVAELIDTFQQWSSRVPMEFADQSLLSQRQLLQDIRGWGEIAYQLRPLFERALNEAGITAWVGVNDRVSLMALAFLRKQGVVVPQKISVTGFDDIRTAQYHRLTTYNFNVRAIAAAMLRHVLKMPMPGIRSNSSTIEIEGMVIERGTSAPVR